MPTRNDLQPPETGTGTTELAAHLSFLNYLRDRVIAKLDGVTDAQAHHPGTSSGTSLAWLIDHLAGVEYGWVVAGYAGVGPDDAEPAPLAPDATVDALIARYRASIAEADAVIASAPDLTTPGKRSLRTTPPPSMRWILLHLIEETARHAGHADIIREHIDGAVGR